MAFKKKSKTPKKKSKGAKKDDWTFEGGQSASTSNENENENDNKRKRRQTQDRDERLRRGRAKLDERKRKKQFTVKMSKKIKFSDILEVSDDETDNEVATTESKVQKRAVVPNPLSVSDRLQLFVSKSLSHASQSSDSDDDHSEDDNSESISDSAQLPRKLSTLVEATEDHDVNENDDEEEQEAELADSTQLTEDQGSSNYDWFLSTKTALEPAVLTKGGKKSSSSMKLLSQAGADDVYGCLNPAVNVGSSAYKSISSIPGLHKLWKDKQSDENEFSESCGKILPFVGTYADALIESGDRDQDRDLLHMLLAHAVTHVVKARAKVLKHNMRLKRKSKDALVAAALAKATETGSDGKKKNKKGKSGADTLGSFSPVGDSADTLLTGAESEALQDQGFCRPRVLILCPFRGTAMQIVEELQRLLGENTSVSGLEKLREEFSAPDEEDGDEADFDPSSGDKKRKGPAKKPADWDALFKDQNIDDDFKIGIQVNPGHGKGSGADKGVYMRLFSDFFISDIIVASPIGLRLSIEGGGSNTSSGAKQVTSAGDFLSSVEMVLLHQADVMYMQNWEHVDFVMRQTNKLPNSNHDTDFSRVRPYFLEGNGALHRQLLLTSSFVEPEIQALFRDHGKSVAGTLRVKRRYEEGSISDVTTPVKQVFQLVPSVTSFDTQGDVRFSYFRDTVLAQILRLEQTHTLIVTPSYLSYVRVRNELMHQNANAAYVCEYSRDSEISRGRSRFFHGTKDILLYSGRAHFFRRFQIKGARHVVFYSLLEYAHFYPEIVNLLNSSGAAEDNQSLSCLVLYTQYERLALERLVGKKRCDHMMSSAKATFMFC